MKNAICAIALLVCTSGMISAQSRTPTGLSPGGDQFDPNPNHPPAGNFDANAHVFAECCGTDCSRYDRSQRRTTCRLAVGNGPNN